MQKKRKMKDRQIIEEVADRFKILGNSRNIGILDYLIDKEEPVSSDQIARKLGVQKESIHKYIQRLEKAGYIKRIEQKGTKELQYQLTGKTISVVLGNIEELVKNDIKKKIGEYESLLK